MENKIVDMWKYPIKLERGPPSSA